MNSRLLTGLGGLLFAAGAILFFVQIIPFSQAPPHATLVIQASNAGARVAAKDGAVSVYVAGSADALLAQGDIDESFSLAQGRYDVHVRFTRSRDQQSLWLRELDLDAGDQLVERVEFAAGEIMVEASVGSTQSEPGEVLVQIFRPGKYEEILTSVPAGQPVLLGAGEYDLRVVWLLGALEKDVRWYRGVQVKVGLQTGLEVPFQRGVLMVSAENAGDPLPPGSVAFTVYREGDTQRQVIDTGSAGDPLGLPSGRYDIKATYLKSSDKPGRWLRGINIGDGEVIEHTVQFSSGALAVAAALSGGGVLAPYDAYVYYYRVGDHEQAVSYTPAGESAILEQGRYDVRASFFRSHDQPDIWLRDVVVTAGEEASHAVYFPSGRLLVRAYQGDGEELIGDSVFVYIYAAAHRARHIARVRAGEFATLAGGTYDIRAVDTRSGATIAWLAGVELRSGMTTERAVALPDP